MAVFIPYIRNILSAVSDNTSTYGMTADPLLSCADLFLFFVSCLFPFLTLVVLHFVENPLWIAAMPHVLVLGFRMFDYFFYLLCDIKCTIIIGQDQRSRTNKS